MSFSPSSLQPPGVNPLLTISPLHIQSHPDFQDSDLVFLAKKINFVMHMDYDNMMVVELIAISRERGLKGYSRLRKVELITLLQDNIGQDPDLDQDSGPVRDQIQDMA